jgi:hypothetical protein
LIEWFTIRDGVLVLNLRGLYSCSIGEKGVILIRAKVNSYEEVLSKLPIFLHKKGRVLEQSPVNRDLRKLYAHENIGAFMLDYEVFRSAPVKLKFVYRSR